MAALLFGLGGCGCKNNPLKEIPSPDGSLTAVLFDRGCGATTGPNLQMSVVARGELPPGEGNVLILDTGHDTTLLRGDLISLVRVGWIEPRKLLVSYNAKLRLFKRERHISGISIKYVASP